jgi:glycosyltransferase involved in cell wall biosynthesis
MIPTLPGIRHREMNILMLTPLTPFPPDAGVRIRLWEQIKYLGQRHTLTLVSFVSSIQEYAYKQHIEEYCDRAILVLHRPQPLPQHLQTLLQIPKTLQWYRTPEMTEILVGLRTESFDLVLIEQIFMAQYGELFSQPTVLQEHNIESDILRQLTQLRFNADKSPHLQKKRAFEHMEWMLLARYENETWPKFPLRITVSEHDRQELQSRCSAGETVVANNGINIDTILPVVSSSARTILFMGTMNYAPNIDAVLYLCEAILPKVWEADPTVSFIIAGKDPTPAILQLRHDSRIEVIPNPPRMEPIAERCQLTIVPLRSGGGTRIKILHSMALGLPVVSTSMGSFGLPVVDGQHLLIRDDPEKFAEAIIEILSDPDLMQRLQTKGRQLVEERFSWNQQFSKLEQALQDLVFMQEREQIRSNTIAQGAM